MSNIAKTISDAIKATLQEHGLETKRIILFGSRARGTEEKDSDWDLMVLVDRELSFEEKRLLTTRIKRKLARMRIPNDIIIKSVHGYEKAKKLPGHLAYYVEREGITL